MSLRGVLASLAILIAPAAAAAQEAGGRAAAFQAGAQHEDVPGGMLVIAAYGIVFVLMLAYVLLLGLRQANVSRDIEQLRKDVERAGARADERAGERE
ncbi:MAG: CcmD family protein [Sandaracinaceae bacterium]|nr:CcmD family protein [Sandaracinaceae bacterium]